MSSEKWCRAQKVFKINYIIPGSEKCMCSTISHKPLDIVFISNIFN